MWRTDQQRDVLRCRVGSRAPTQAHAMSRDLPYPVPTHMRDGIEYLLGDIDDRGDLAWKLRSMFGQVYAQGHHDGRMARMQEEHWDRAAADRAKSKGDDA